MRPNSRRTTLLALVIAGPLGILLIVLALRWDALPGTFHRDDQGVAHGTGRVTYDYTPGVKQVVEQYYRGQLVRSEWFRPDGTSIQVTLWEDESGEGLYLRKDGSVWSRRQYIKNLWDGVCTYYNRDGSMKGTATGKQGAYVSGYKPAMGEREEP